MLAQVLTEQATAPGIARVALSTRCTHEVAPDRDRRLGVDGRSPARGPRFAQTVQAAVIPAMNPALEIARIFSKPFGYLVTAIVCSHAHKAMQAMQVTGAGGLRQLASEGVSQRSWVLTLQSAHRQYRQRSRRINPSPVPAPHRTLYSRHDTCMAGSAGVNPQEVFSRRWSGGNVIGAHQSLEAARQRDVAATAWCSDAR